jgi:hypothetical protein
MLVKTYKIHISVQKPDFISQVCIKAEIGHTGHMAESLAEYLMHACNLWLVNICHVIKLYFSGA